MHTLRRGLCWLFWGGVFLFGQSASWTFGEESSSTTPGTKNCLWEMQGNENRVYLLGSIHFMKEEMFPLPDSMDSLLDKVRTVVFETDLRQAAGTEFGPWMQREMTCPGDETLKDAIGQGMHDRIIEAGESLGIDAIIWDNVRPWFVATSLPQVKLEKMGYRSSLGLDVLFLKRAEGKGLAIEALDEIREHIRVYSKMDEPLQKEFLQYSLDRLSVLDRSFPELCAAWKTGDIDTLVRLRKEGIGSYKGLHQRLFLDRNERWLPRVEAFLEREDDVLIVMGFGHLVGQGSLIEMLGVKGHTVTQR